MRFLALRLVAAVLTPLTLLQPTRPCAAVTPAPVIEMDHISVMVVGSGPPVILIPGLSSPRTVWDGILPELARTHRVYLVQVNGFDGGDPGANLKPGLLDGVVADLDTLIARETMKAPAVIGHSMGGLVALMLAKAHPGDVGRLMIVDALPFYAVLFSPAATVATVEPIARAQRDQIVAGYGKPADPAGAEKIANGLALKPDSRAKVKAWMAIADQRVTGEALYEDLTTDLRPDLAGIRTPITLVYPWNDAGPTKPMADQFYRAAYKDAPKVTFVDIGDARHFVMLDQPAAFAAAVAAFLK